MKTLHIILLSICFLPLASAQKHHFGFQLSLMKDAQIMQGDIGDIHLYLQSSTDIYPSLGIFYHYKLHQRIGLRGEIMFLNQSYGPVAYNKADTSPFGPLEIPRSAIGNPVLTFPLSASVGLVKGLDFFAGITPHITLSRIGEPSVNVDPRYVKEFEAMDAVIPAIKSAYAFYAMGFRLVLKERVEVSARFHRLLSDGFLNALMVGNQSYRFPSRYMYVDITVGYRFHRFKWPRKNSN